MPKRVRRIGCRGKWSIGRIRSGVERVESSPTGRRRGASTPPPSAPRPCGGLRRSSAPCTPALPSSSGCARSTSGQQPLEAVALEVERAQNGEAAAIGCTAEQWSWSTPGTVSSRRARAAADLVGGLEHRHLEAARARARPRRRARSGRSRRRRRRSRGLIDVDAVTLDREVGRSRRATAAARPCPRRSPSPPRSGPSAASWIR